jgi:hypothetical protein
MLVALLVLWGVFGVATSLGYAPLAAWIAMGATLAVVATIDALRLRRAPSPRVSRQLPDAGAGRGTHRHAAAGGLPASARGGVR